MGFTYILCAIPGQTQQALTAGMRLAHMAWQIGPGLELVETGVVASMRGGYMMLGDAYFDGSNGDVYRLADAVGRECLLRGFDGLVCDFEQRFSRVLDGFIAECVPICRKKGVQVFVPEPYAHSSPHTKIYIPTALSSGSLGRRLREAVDRYNGPERIVLEMERMRRDIILPSPQGAGRSMQPEELERLLTGRQGGTFYSQEMCTRYFTYKDERENTHFILYDDAACFVKKAQLALSYGIRAGFVLYPEAEDFIPTLKLN